ncbi:FecR domain-containing protein [Pseudomonas sp. F1_0610]|uniref:FecR domain-containing protein n=1 Tax=Pseudomonas sp. F1_0610 TaxID=3114284 RepID=UPI0039C25620
MITPKQHQALVEAANWYAQSLNVLDQAAFAQQLSQWRQLDLTHEWAWQRVESLQQEFQQVPQNIAAQTLIQNDQQKGVTRRQTVLGLFLLAGASSIAWRGYQQLPYYLAEHRTAKGEQKKINLPDGSQLFVNTDTAVNTDYTNEKRQVYLLKGEIYIQTAKDPRPFYVVNQFGQMQALGTQFSVRQRENENVLSVQQSAVRVTLADSQEQLLVEEGTTLYFDQQRHRQKPIKAVANSWIYGTLAIDDWPLAKLLGQLERYHSIFINLDPEAGKLRLSGAYPILDLDGTLNAIARAVLVKIEKKLGFIVSISATS